MSHPENLISKKKFSPLQSVKTRPGTHGVGAQTKEET